MDQLHKKLQTLYDYIKSLGSLAVGFSGGVDSSFLLKCAHDLLGDKAIAVTVRSPFFPKREFEESVKFARRYSIPQVVIDVDVLSINDIAKNPADRCYYCKREVFSLIRKKALEYGIKNIAEGSNIDDLGDYRPGLKAVEECGALSPLRVAGLYKDDIRLLSKELGLDTWNKPSYACLASRVPYGERITEEKLAAIEAAEQYLIDLGFKQIRVRHHGNIARIELLPQDMPKIFENGLAEKISDKLKGLGFTYVTLDLKGYTTGSMNAVLSKDVIEKAKVAD